MWKTLLTIVLLAASTYGRTRLSNLTSNSPETCLHDCLCRNFLRLSLYRERETPFFFQKLHGDVWKSWVTVPMPHIQALWNNIIQWILKSETIASTQQMDTARYCHKCAVQFTSTHVRYGEHDRVVHMQNTPCTTSSTWDCVHGPHVSYVSSWCFMHMVWRLNVRDFELSANIAHMECLKHAWHGGQDSSAAVSSSPASFSSFSFGAFKLRVGRTPMTPHG